MLFVDESFVKEALSAFAADRPALAFGKGLFEEGKIGEGFHCVDAAALELIAEEVEIETGFEMVHAGFEKTFAMKTDPKADGAELRSGRKFLGGEIDLRFLGHEVDVREDYDADEGLFGDLRAPTGFSAGVVALAFLKAELKQEFDEIDEMFARAAERVMIVVAPAETELILAALLDLGGPIAALPPGAFGGEEEFAGEIAVHELNALVEDFVGGAEAFGVVREEASAGLPEFFGFDDGAELVEIERGRNEAAIGVPFDGFQARTVFFRDNGATVAREGFPLDFGRKVVSGNEIGNEFGAQSDE